MKCIRVPLGDDQRLVEPEVPDALMDDRGKCLAGQHVIGDVRSACLLLMIERAFSEHAPPLFLAEHADLQRHILAQLPCEIENRGRLPAFQFKLELMEGCLLVSAAHRTGVQGHLDDTAIVLDQPGSALDLRLNHWLKVAIGLFELAQRRLLERLCVWLHLPNLGLPLPAIEQPGLTAVGLDRLRDVVTRLANPKRVTSLVDVSGRRVVIDGVLRNRMLAGVGHKIVATDLLGRSAVQLELELNLAVLLTATRHAHPNCIIPRALS